jgi:hypothetical protein
MAWLVRDLDQREDERAIERVGAGSICVPLEPLLPRFREDIEGVIATVPDGAVELVLRWIEFPHESS